MSKTSYYITKYVILLVFRDIPIVTDVRGETSNQHLIHVIWFHRINANREVQAFNLEDYCLKFIMSADSSKIPVMIMLANYFINSCNKSHINAA